MSYKIAVVGATGKVGREMLNCLNERSFPANEVIALASSSSIGTKVSFGDKTLVVQSLEGYSFQDIEIALFSAGEGISRTYAEKAAEQGCVVIDNSSAFRMDDDVPLIVPEVNLSELQYYSKRNIIANPNCVAIQLAVLLGVLNKISKIRRVIASTYQSVSGAGKDAMDELYTQTKSKFMNHSMPPKVFQKQIAFNIIPQIDDFNDNGDTLEEMKIANEIKKIIDTTIEISATCVRVPVFVSHAASVNVEFSDIVEIEELLDSLENAPGIVFTDNNLITPLDIVGEDSVFISRVRKDLSHPKAYNFWIASDNLRKGAALNAVQIAEELVKEYL